MSNKPLQIDVLIKLNDEKIDNEIGKLFRNYNIIEYKSPEDSFNIDDYYKVLAYAYLYKSLREDYKVIEIDEMTISIFGSKKPIKLLKYLEKIEKLNITKESAGVYYINGLTIPIQIINLSELEKAEEQYALMLFSNKNSNMKRAAEILINKEDLIKKEDLIQIIYAKNGEIFWEVINAMSDRAEKRKQEEILLMIKRKFDPEMTKRIFIDEKDKEEIREEARREAKEEARKEELINTAIKLLTKKFGTLPEAMKKGIKNADLDSLEIIRDSIFDFNDLKDVEKYL
ncbi:DUF4351 domain-containing protein [Clostridium thailandense]|uniref:DUF4351 domain-containing protein n=1 Tax=Clostridium thailandense TaxID=2794346 RepID=UPI003989AF15